MSDIENQKSIINHQELFIDEKEEEENECLQDYGICFLTLVVLILAVGGITYLVFGVIFLVEDYNVAQDCNGSNLWAYVLTAIILSWTRGSSTGSSESSSVISSICLLMCIGITELSLAIWGGIELLQNSCVDLEETNLWKFGLATFILQVTCATIFLLVLPISTFFLTRQD